MSEDDLTEISGVGPSTAEKLRDIGYDRFEDLAVAGVGEITAESSIGESKAQKIVNAARDNADVGGFTTGDEALEARKNIGNITSGHGGIDDILSGGFEEEAITELFGEHKTGKSQFTHQLCVNVQLPPEHGGTGKRAVFIDTEDSYRPERIVEMVRGLDDEVLQACMDRDGVDGTPDDEDALDELVEIFLSRIHNASARNSNMQMMLVEKAGEIAQEYRDTEFSVGLLVVDSIIGHFRSEFIGRGELAKRQQKLTQHMDDLTEFSSKYGASVVIANQVMANPDQFFGDPTKAAGGNVIEHRSTFRVKLRQGKGDKKVFMLEDAPNLPDGQTPYLVKTSGIEES
jgi:DNA repair protein RadA